jgi:[acyl-carrier-protein] S-malonyltransferase
VVQEIVSEARGNDILSIANYNTAEQVVITGQEKAITRAIRMVKERKGRAIALNVSGAWHSMLMKDAVEEFRQFMEDIPFEKPRSRVLFNATAGVETQVDKIKDIMAEQLISPVKWHDIMLSMLNDGIEVFVEVGPKKVLTGLLKKTVSPGRDAIETYHVQDLQSLKEFLAQR